LGLSTCRGLTGLKELLYMSKKGRSGTVTQVYFEASQQEHQRFGLQLAYTY
jgi:hypothetical protein